MDWHPMTADSTVETSRRPDYERASRPNAPRLDQVLSVLIDRQVEAVLIGLGMAALHESPAADGRVACPEWLVEDLEIAMHLTRLAYAAGVTLPASLHAVAASGQSFSSEAHLVDSRSRYQAIADVLGQLIRRGDVPESLTDDAEWLLQETRDQLVHIELTRLTEGQARSRPLERRPGQSSLPSFLPGELLG